MNADRGVSVTLSYVLLLAVATTMLVAMVIVVGGLLDSQKNHAVQDELTVTGESLATELEQADRLYQSTADNATSLTVQKRLPTHVSGSTYRIVIDGNAGELTLATTRPEVSISIPVDADALAAEEQSLPGGPVEIVDDGDVLVVQAA